MILCEYISAINVAMIISELHVVNVEDALLLTLYSLMAMSLSVFLQECFQKGMILRRYYVWLIYLQIKNRRIKNEKEKRQKMLKRKFIRMLTYPAGACVYCNNVYVSGLITGILTNDLMSMILGIGMSNLFLIYHERITNV